MSLTYLVYLPNIIHENLIIFSLLTQRPPFVILTTNENDTILGVKGFCFEIIQSLADKYNFT